MVVCRACHLEVSFESDPTSGTAFCPNCGSVAEENGIVAEVTFGENSSGAAIVNGAYVGADQTRVKAPGGRRPAGAGGVESREQTIANGRRKIQSMINALKLPDRFTDQAQRFYSLALNNNFVRGRRTNYVVSACLYVVCRMEKTSHMLIDFSDLLQVNVFVLGSTYLKLVKDLNLTIPAIDPSLFISRFASLLEFGDETQQVANDATRLVQRFSRDWMQTGRRPAGICGAALVLAARMNNFRRSIEEVVQVVKIADVTLKKRLTEFSQTPSSALTITDFRTVDLTETADPPAYVEGRVLEKKQRAKTKRVRFSKTGVLSDEEEEEEDEEDDDEQDEQDGSSPVRKRLKGEMLAINAEMAQITAGQDGAEEDDEDEDAFNVPLSEQDEEGNIRNALASIGAAEQEERETRARSRSATPSMQSAVALGWKPTKAPPPDLRSAEEMEADEAESASIAGAITEELSAQPFTMISTELSQKESARWLQAQNPGLLTLRDSPPPGQYLNAEGYSVPLTNDDGNLSDLDEDELDAFILTPDEVRIKERLWMEFNKDYLANVAEKHLRAELDERPIKRRDRKKRVGPRDSSMPSGETAAESTKQLLKQKKFSKKINYAAIDSLLSETADSFMDIKQSNSGDFYDDAMGGDNDYDGMSVSSSRAPSLAPSVAGSEGGYSSSGTLLKEKRRRSSSSNRRASASIEEAERLKRKIEKSKAASSSSSSGLAGKRISSGGVFGSSSAKMGKKPLQPIRRNAAAQGDPNKGGSPIAKRQRLSEDGMDGSSVPGSEDVVEEDAVARQEETAQIPQHQDIPEEDDEDDEEEEEEEEAPQAEEDDAMAEFNRMRNRSGGDDDEAW